MTNTLKKIATSVLHGFYDCIAGTIRIYQVQDLVCYSHSEMSSKKRQSSTSQVEKENIRSQLVRCCGLNGLVYLLVLVFAYGFLFNGLNYLHYLLTGSIEGSSLVAVLQVFFKTCWVIPLFFVCKAINSYWFQDIANASLFQLYGKPRSLSLKYTLADFIYTIIFQLLFLCQAVLVEWFPIEPIGRVLYMIHMSLLYSLYCFEYKWCHLGWEIHRRLAFIQLNWPYFLGFGLPLTVITGLTHDIFISGGIFALLFPFFLISGNEAEPFQEQYILRLNLFAPAIFFCNTFSRLILCHIFPSSSSETAKESPRHKSEIKSILHKNS